MISWALLVALPAMAAVCAATMPGDWSGVGGAAWAGLGYVSVFSMLVGFVFWYRGLALGESHASASSSCCSRSSGWRSPRCCSANRCPARC